MEGVEVITLSSDEEEEESVPKRVCNEVTIAKISEVFSVAERKKESSKYAEDSITIIINDKPAADDKKELLALLEDKTGHSVPSGPSASEDCVSLDGDSEDETEPSNATSSTCESIEEDTKSNGEVTSKSLELLERFLETCTASLKGTQFESRLLPIFPKMRKQFDLCMSIHNKPNLNKLLEDHNDKAKSGAAVAIISFEKVFSYLKDQTEGVGVEIPVEKLNKVKKLEKTCKLLTKKIKELEEKEVDFDDEENSSYLQLEAYQKRLVKVYALYCKLIKRNPHVGRLTYEKLQFVSSKYVEINRAITRDHKTHKFPAYYTIEECVRKCVAENNLGLSEAEIKEESKSCFEKLGNLMQMRRKKELYEAHCSFITLNEDPANNDPDLNVKLQNSQKEGSKKLNEIVERYVILQQTGGESNSNSNPDLSSSENSDSESSGSDDDKK